MRWCRRFTEDEEGTVTIEFLLTFPLLVLWLMGSYVFFDIYKSESKASKAAYAIADIMSRQEDVDQAELLDYYTLLDRLLPRASDDKWMRISSISYDEANEAYEVEWSYVRAPLGDAQKMTNETIPENDLPMVADNDSVILVEIEIPYTPIVSSVGLTNLEWKPRVVMRPRFIAKVVCTDCS